MSDGYLKDIVQRFRIDVASRWCFKEVQKEVCPIKWFTRRIKGQGNCSYCIHVVWRSITVWSLRQHRTKPNQTVQQLIAPQGIFLKVTAGAGQELGDLMTYPPLPMCHGDRRRRSWTLQVELQTTEFLICYTTTITRRNLPGEKGVQINLFTSTFQILG